MRVSSYNATETNFCSLASICAILTPRPCGEGTMKVSGRGPVRRNFHDYLVAAAVVAASHIVFPFGTMSIADDFYRVYGVNVYLGGAPECQVKDFSREVRARVAPFEQAAPLGEIVGELARLAAEQGANMLHSIRILSAVPNQGADVAGVAARCTDKASPQPNALPGLDNELVAAVKTAPSVVAYALPDAGAVGLDRSVDQSKLVTIRELDGTALDRLRNLILSAGSFDLTPGLAKPCPFIPNIGFKFAAAGTEAWWLVSYSCETAILARRSDRWPRVPPLNLKAESLQAFQQLAK
jgi:hypothetical protein